jgi:transcriptional repressor NF-X1
MSSPPPAQIQQQPTNLNRNLERTDKRNPHRNRNRDQRSVNVNHNDASGSRDETGATTDRRRRAKPKGSNADEPHASPSTLVTSQTNALPLRPLSDRTEPADPASVSAHTSSNNRNRNRPPHPAKDRAIARPAQDANSLPSGPSRHTHRGAGRPNPGGSLTETQAPASEPNPRRKRVKVPAGDDLTSILTHSLSTPPFPECMICFNPIRPEQPTWSCSPREEKEAQSCWNTFHLKCIHPWAEKSVKDLEQAWRARGEEKRGEWRCPGCQSRREIVPRRYW